MEMNSLKFYKSRIVKKANKLNCLRQVPDYLLPMINGHHRIDIADMGSGPFSTIGILCDQCNINLRAFDVRAEGYNKICSDAGIVPIVAVEHQDMEHTTLPSNSFDIVHCQNALDHIKNPRKAIYEFARICKDGGWIYLKHYKNCAEKQKYYSGHFWNLEKFNDKCRIWNQDEFFFLDDILSGWVHQQNQRMIVSYLNLKKWQQT